MLSLAWGVSLPPSTKLLLVALADFADDSGVCWPSVDTLAARTGLGRSTVLRHIASLDSSGLLVRGRRSAHPYSPNRYRLSADAMATAAEASAAVADLASTGHVQRSQSETSQNETTVAEQAEVPIQDVSNRDVQNRERRGPDLSSQTSQIGTQTIIEPTEEPPLPPAADAPTAQTIVGEWIERCRKRPPRAVIGQMAKQIDALLKEGIDPDDIRRGVAEWMRKDRHPSVLPSIVNGVMNSGAASGASVRPETGNRRLNKATAALAPDDPLLAQLGGNPGRLFAIEGGAAA